MRPYFRLLYYTIVLLISAACAGIDYYYESTTNIKRNAFVPSEFAPLAYYEDSRFAWDENQFIEYPSFNQSVVEDWEKYLGAEVLTDSLSKLILDDSLQAVIAFQKSLGEAKLNKNPKFNAFLNYLKLAKKAESYSTSDNMYWWREPLKTDSLSQALSTELVEYWQACEDGFIKSRMEFQLIRNSYFSGNFIRGIDIYNRYVTKRPEDLMSLRSKSYAAGCYYKMGRFSDANAMYADIMAADKRFTQSMTYSFRPQEELDFIQTLKKCSNDESRICAWVMMAFYTGDAARAMREVRKINANHNAIDLLLSRQLANYESLINNNYYYESDDTERLNKLNFLKINLSNDLVSLLGDAAYQRKYKAHAALSYFSYLNNDIAQCEYHLNQAFEKQRKQDTVFSQQVRIFKVLLRAENPKAYNAEDIEDLRWIFDRAQGVWDGTGDTFRAYEILLSKLQKYFKAQNHAAADVLLPSMESLDKIENIDAAISFLDTKDDSQLHNFIRQYAGIDKSQLYQLQSIYYVKKGMLKQAYEAAASISEETTFDGNPFSFRIRDCHDCDFAEYQGEKYTRVSFLKEMLRLEDQLMKSASFEDAILLGNAYYNLSYHGNLRQFFYTNYPLHGFTEEKEQNWDFNYWYWPMNYDVKHSITYYKKALELANTKEQKAQAFYLISKCELAEYYNSRGEEDEADFIARDGFQGLKEMEDSKFRKMVLQECGYFKTYFTNKK
jgi:hypothetical protein